MVAIDEIVIHPSYDPSGYPYDIALLKVLFSISQGTSVLSYNMSHFNFNQSTIMAILQKNEALYFAPVLIWACQ